jgi:hypothetical protein
MSSLVWKAYIQLIRFDLYLAREDFPSLREAVRRHPVRHRRSGWRSFDDICHAVDMACIWYWKEAQCLHRSAATTCVLKDCGVPAQMVIGAQPMPFRAHAWVEVDGRVVNDKPYIAQMYAVLDRC